MKNNFNYGRVLYKHRFNINRSLSDYNETLLNKCIRIGLVYKYRNMKKNSLYAEIQILYRDNFNELKCLKLDLHNYTFKILHKGDMQIDL